MKEKMYKKWVLGHKEKIHLPLALAARTDQKKVYKILPSAHMTLYMQNIMLGLLCCWISRVWMYIWSWQVMESQRPTSQYDDSLNVLPKIVKFTQEPSFTELLTWSSTVARLTAHSWSVTLTNLQACTVSPCTENARRKTYTVPLKSYALVLAQMVFPFLWILSLK